MNLSPKPEQQQTDELYASAVEFKNECATIAKMQLSAVDQKKLDGGRIGKLETQLSMETLKIQQLTQDATNLEWWLWAVAIVTNLLWLNVGLIYHFRGLMIYFYIPIIVVGIYIWVVFSTLTTFEKWGWVIRPQLRTVYTR